VANAFGQVKDSLSWVVANYPTLAYWRSVVERLDGFEGEVERTKRMRQKGLAVLGSNDEGSAIRLNGLSLSLPGQDQPLTKPLEMDFGAGRSVLISGPSGCGKSTFLRALCGLWPFSEGQILLPRNQSVMVIPQKPYLPIGSLRSALVYPSLESEISESELIKLISLCHLEHLSGRLGDIDNWALILSVGEQQRVAWARVFLHKPQWLFLDEATSALDEGTQDRIYSALKEQLPGTTMISVAHRQNPEEHHQAIWKFGAALVD
jgi:putative ATP-binding cassette transporter